jgi:hypothetical protein
MQRRLLLLAFTFVVALGVGSSVALAGGGNSAAAKLCQKNGWQTLQSSSGGAFSSQSACVSYSANGGTLFGPKLTATENGCQVAGFEGFDLWTLSASGFTPNSSLTINSVLLWPRPFDSSGSITIHFIPDSGGLTPSETFTDGNGLHASVTFGPTTTCPA